MEMTCKSYERYFASIFTTQTHHDLCTPKPWCAQSSVSTQVLNQCVVFHERRVESLAVCITHIDKQSSRKLGKLVPCFLKGSLIVTSPCTDDIHYVHYDAKRAIITASITIKPYLYMNGSLFHNNVIFSAYY